MPKLAYNVLLVDEGGGSWSAFCMELRGCMTQGESEQEALENIIEAITLNIDWLRSEGRPIPSAQANLHSNGVMVIPDLIPGDVQSEYPHLDEKMFHSGLRKTVLVS